jgi:hypothetical protein
MHLGHDEVSDAMLAEAKMPNAPVYHHHAPLLQVDDNLGCGIVGDVHPE